MAAVTHLADVLGRHVQAGTMPGAVATVGRDLDPVAVGSMSLDGPPMPVDAIVRIQSMTKLVTAVAALRLVEEGVLDLDDPVQRWLPELADRVVLRHPAADLDDTCPAARPITLRHLLTCTSGYGQTFTDSPLRRAIAASGLEGSGEPVALAADDWLHALAALPLAADPGDGWRYHDSYGLLGILLGRLTGASTSETLAATVLDPVGMVDTGFAVPERDLHRLPAAYRHTAAGLAEIEPAGAGFYAVAPPFDVSHAELVSTAADYVALLRALLEGRLVAPEHLAALRTDQVPAHAKRPDDFFPDFWTGTGWGWGVAVETEGSHRGRFGWSGGLGTDFFVDEDGTIGVLLTQVEMGERVFPLLRDVQAVAD